VSYLSVMDGIGGALKSETAAKISVFETGEDLAYWAADECVRLALGAVAARDTFSIALAGGSTPKRLYALLASEYPGSFRQRFPKSRQLAANGSGAVGSRARCLPFPGHYRSR